MALSIEVTNAAVRTEFEHPSGPLEFGRGPQREIPRCVIAGDQSVSRDHRASSRSPTAASGSRI